MNMIDKKQIKIWIAIKLFNIGMRLLPQGYSNKSFIDNCIHTGIIKRRDKTLTSSQNNISN